MRINDEYGKLPGSYLFAEIARRLKLYQTEQKLPSNGQVMMEAQILAKLR